jgi:hypothetical protein
MTASLETLVVAAYVFATTFRIPRPGPIGKVSDEEIVALAVAQAITGAVSDRRFLGTIDRLLPGFFPEVPDQAQYNRRLRRHHDRAADARRAGRRGSGPPGRRHADRLRQLPGLRIHERLRRARRLWLLPIQEPFVWGMPLVLLADPKGVAVGYDLVGPKTGQERDAVLH